MKQRMKDGASAPGRFVRGLSWVVLAVACSASGSDGSASSPVVRGPGGRAGICCPIDPGTCNGFRAGGWAPSLGECGLLYDAAPPTRIDHDAYGCEVLVATGSCLDVGRDAGPDVVAVDVAPDIGVAPDTGVAPVTPCPGATACHPFVVPGAHSGVCPIGISCGQACTESCLACMPTSPDGGPGVGSGSPCVCDGTRWVCPSDSGVGCAADTTCWIAGPPPVCR